MQILTKVNRQFQPPLRLRLQTKICGRNSIGMGWRLPGLSLSGLCRHSVVVGLMLLGGAFASHAGDTNELAVVTQDYQMKAQFLLSFAKFVEWPTNAPGGAKRLCIGIMGTGKNAGIITNELAGQRVGDKVIETKLCKTVDDLKQCAMIFITRAKAGRMDDVQKALTHSPVLTVGEFGGFIERGGCINFVRKGENIRLEVNLGATERAGLKVSSKISSLTISIKGKEAGK